MKKETSIRVDRDQRINHDPTKTNHHDRANFDFSPITSAQEIIVPSTQLATEESIMGDGEKATASHDRKFMRASLCFLNLIIIVLAIWNVARTCAIEKWKLGGPSLVFLITSGIVILLGFCGTYATLFNRRWYVVYMILLVCSTILNAGVICVMLVWEDSIIHQLLKHKSNHDDAKILILWEKVLVCIITGLQVIMIVLVSHLLWHEVLAHKVGRKDLMKYLEASRLQQGSVHAAQNIDHLQGFTELKDEAAMISSGHGDVRPPRNSKSPHHTGARHSSHDSTQPQTKDKGISCSSYGKGDDDSMQGLSRKTGLPMVEHYSGPRKTSPRNPPSLLSTPIMVTKFSNLSYSTEHGGSDFSSATSDSSSAATIAMLRDTLPDPGFFKRSNHFSHERN